MRNALFTECSDFSSTHSKLFVDEHDGCEGPEVVDLIDFALSAHSIYCSEVGCDIDQECSEGGPSDWDGDHHQKWLKISLRFLEAGLSLQQLIDVHDTVTGTTGNSK